ncbi:Hypothetical protein GLP15_3354 [Giardia lamblia P15]|uniref:Uncharacterized protein n=1 Tax=Giardia intestinalis (strain P15) TaxID=658858 RepID=E1EVV1_GIAIA|nr:Hypothetical protein GLP15_3354 [Giardia lamblia P15]
MTTLQQEKVDFITQKLAEAYTSRPRSTAFHGNSKPSDFYSIGLPSSLAKSMGTVHSRLASTKLTSINSALSMSVLAEANHEYNGTNHNLFFAVRRSANLNDDKKLESVIAARIKDSQRPISTTRPMGSAASTIGITSVYEQKAPDSARLFDGAAASSHSRLSTKAIDSPAASRPTSSLSQSGYTKGTVITVSREPHETIEVDREAHQDHLQTPASGDSRADTNLHKYKQGWSRSSSRRESRAGSRVPSAIRKSTALDIEALAVDDVHARTLQQTIDVDKQDVAASPKESGSLDVLPYAPHVRPIQKHVTLNRLNDGLRILRETNMRYGLGNMEPNNRPIIANPALTVAGIVQPIQSVLTEQMMIASSDISLQMKEMTMAASGINLSKLSEQERDSLDTQYIAFGKIAKPPSVTTMSQLNEEDLAEFAKRRSKSGTKSGTRGSSAKSAISGASARQQSAAVRLGYTRISDKIKLEKAKLLKQQQHQDVGSASEARTGIKNTVNYQTAISLDGSQRLRGYSAVAASNLLSNTMVSAPELNSNVVQENVGIIQMSPEQEELSTRITASCVRRDSGFSPIYGFRPPNILSDNSSKARVDLSGCLGGR